MINSLKSKEILSQTEYEQLAAAYPDWTAQFLFYNSWNNTYLNLEVYSEAEKERHDLRKEIGY